MNKEEQQEYEFEKECAMFTLQTLSFEELVELIATLNVENKQLKDNWNKLKEWNKHERKVAVGMQNCYGIALCDCMINEMQEIEKGEQDVQ